MKKIIYTFVIITIVIVAQSFKQGNSNTSIQNGKNVYTLYCQSCHMEDGNGVEGAFPSLVKTGNLVDKNRLVKVVLNGIRGSITVKGVKYDSEMAGFDLTDKEAADVINYIRNSWGNKFALMQSNEVAAAKKAIVKGYQSY